MAFIGICPYLKDSREVRSVVCECAKFTFPDKYARRDVLYGVCGHPTAWMDCAFKKALDAYYYERKFSCERKGIVRKNRSNEEQSNAEGKKKNQRA